MIVGGEVLGVLGVGSRDPRPPIRPGRPRGDRGFRRARDARHPACRQLRGARPAEPDRARFLPRRLCARPAAVTRRDGRRRRTGRVRGTRRQLRRGADAGRRRPAARRPLRASRRHPRNHLGPPAVPGRLQRAWPRRGRPGRTHGHAPRRRLALGRAGTLPARCSPSRSTPRAEWPSSSLRMIARSATTTSRSPATWPTRRRERSSAVRCSSASGARAGSRSIWPGSATFLATELDPSRVVEEVAAEAPELLGADVGAIRLVEGDELVLRAASADAGEEHAGTRSPVAAGLAGDVVAVPQRRCASPTSTSGTAVDPDPLLGRPPLLSRRAADGRGGWPARRPLCLFARRQGLARRRGRGAVALAGNASTALSTAELYQRVAVEKERSETILAHVADGIVAVDRDGKVVLWNEAATRITGIDRGDVLGRDPAEVLKRSLADPESEDGGTRILAIPRGGEEVWLSLSEAVMRDPERRDRGADLHLPRHLRPAARRADEVRIRLHRLAPAARAAHVHLRLRRDAAPPRRQLQRRGAAHLPPVHRLGV